MTAPTDEQIRELLAKAKQTGDKRVVFLCKIALDEGATHRTAKQIRDAKRQVADLMRDMTASATHPDFFMQVASWCERHDDHPAEGWLALVLDGTLAVSELRSAILADRDPKES